jgi:hypothetical protein
MVAWFPWWPWISIVDGLNPHDKFTCVLGHSHLRAHACSKVVDTFDQDSRVRGFCFDTSSPCVPPWRRLVRVELSCVFRDCTNRS